MPIERTSVVDYLIQEIDVFIAADMHNAIPEFVEGNGQVSVDYYTKRLTSKQYKILAAKDSATGDYMGYLVAYDRDNDGSYYFWMAGVVPKYRKKGVYQKLSKTMENWAKDNNFHTIKIKTRNNKRDMLAFLVRDNFMFTQVLLNENILENRIELEKSL